ncbi:hypothetical protein K504DRAFT_150463 [Pleomassaria siparia CBS 279.74]|uniref:Uncharacterized protein n=1 Tax=Pleomassaria siparia CBS 279.74 TaxID=1314801 RepID=A0A6G1KMW3_9PLEO|nr:hypothetical protein K504DRAFT_150463 [Pleomassaria siparia CBS 279.74]
MPLYVGLGLFSAFAVAGLFPCLFSLQTENGVNRFFFARFIYFPDSWVTLFSN